MPLLPAILLGLSCRVLTTDKGDAVRDWRAHAFPVTSLAAVGTTVFSLAEDGAVRGWPATPPPAAFVAAWQVWRRFLRLVP